MFLFSCNSSDDPPPVSSRIEKQKQIEEFAEAARKGHSHTIILMLENGIMDRQAALDRIIQGKRIICLAHEFIQKLPRFCRQRDGAINMQTVNARTAVRIADTRRR